MADIDEQVTAAEVDAELRGTFLDTLYETLRETDAVSPTPLIEVTESTTTRELEVDTAEGTRTVERERTEVDVEYLDGRGNLPSDDSWEVTALDIEIASLFFDDFHVLYEGDTGVGKTYVTETLFETLFGPEGYMTIQLEGGMKGGSPLDPFIETEMNDGSIDRWVDRDAVQQYGGVFIDEVNRAEFKDLSMLLKGEIYAGEDRAHVGVPIPGTDRYKGVSVVGAMNPATADFNTLTMDKAKRNRWLRFNFPNNAVQVGASQLDTDIDMDEMDGSTDDGPVTWRKILHDRFWDRFAEQTGYATSWQQVVPAITDQQTVETELDGRTQEFFDIVLGYLGDSPSEDTTSRTYADNRSLIQQAGYTPRFSPGEGNNTDRIADKLDLMEENYTNRDIDKLRDMSNLLAFIEGVKDKTYDVETSLTNVATAAAVLSEGKTGPDTDYGQYVPLVNDILNTYNDVVDEVVVPDGSGVREGIWSAAVYGAQTGDVDDPFEGYRSTLQNNIEQLNQPTSDPAEAIVRSRLIADLATLEHFSDYHADEVAAALDADDPFDAFDAVYEEHRHESSAYVHRLGTFIDS